MGQSLNMVVLIGRVGRRPELRTTAFGARVATFSVATDRQRAGRAGGEREPTDWHRIVAWDSLADWTAKRLDRGSRVFVEGRVEYRSWSDRSGRRRDTTEIVAEDVMVFDTARAGSSWR
ncbi:MAG: single-stranded DNA-binding protein [Longimicrobiales bacterium]